MEANGLKFRHCIDIQVRYSDIDMNGHVNNTIYGHYFDTARVHYFESILKYEIDWNKDSIIMAHTEIDYKSPIFFHDKTRIYTKVSRLGNKSFDMRHVVLDIQTGELKTIAMAVMIAYDVISHKTIEIPKVWRNAVLEYDTEVV